MAPQRGFSAFKTCLSTVSGQHRIADVETLRVACRGHQQGNPSPPGTFGLIYGSSSQNRLETLCQSVSHMGHICTRSSTCSISADCSIHCAHTVYTLQLHCSDLDR